MKWSPNFNTVWSKPSLSTQREVGGETGPTATQGITLGAEGGAPLMFKHQSPWLKSYLQALLTYGCQVKQIWVRA